MTFALFLFKSFSGKRISIVGVSELDQGQADVDHSVRNRAGDRQDQIRSGLGDQDVRGQEVDGRPQEGGQRVEVRRTEDVEADRDDPVANYRPGMRTSAGR